MFQKILVPLDGSPRAECALPIAIRLARASQGALVLVHLVMPPSEVGEYGAESEFMAVAPSSYEKHPARGEHYLQKVVRAHEQDLAGIPVEQEVETGDPVESMFSLARMDQVDLIVLCSHGAHPFFHWMFKSVARAAVHQSPVPLLVVKEHGCQFLTVPEGQKLRMLVTLDGSSLAEEALEPALQLLSALAAPEAAEMHLTQVVEVPSVEGRTLLQSYEIKSLQERALEEAEEYLLDVTHRLIQSLPATAHPLITWSLMVSTHVARTLTEMTRPAEHGQNEYGYHLVAMATHGRTGLQLMRLGSVTEHVLGATDLPLLIVRPPRPAEHGRKDGARKERAAL